MVDLHYMRHALALARRGLGVVAPNPAVGCVIVKDGRIIGRGWTQKGGRPHAETEALAQAGVAARGADVYVTLEPCAHHGQTPPCAGALIAAHVARVIIAIEDPDPRVMGKGVALLNEAGIETILGVGESEASYVNEGFLKLVREGLPMVTLKAATSLDGRIATATAESKWITGPDARKSGHMLRASHDAILTGIGTVIDDNPELTCRIAGLEERSPIRVVIDSWLRFPEGCRLAQTAQHVPTWVATLAHADPARKRALEKHGIEIIEVEAGHDGRPDLALVIRALGARGVTRVLVEAGATVNTALLNAGMVDRIAWYRAPRLIGGDGLPVMEALDVKVISAAPEFVLQNNFQIGADSLETYRRDH